MFDMYRLTEMEKKIEELYKQNGILTPHDLDMTKIAKSIGIKLTYTDGPSLAIWDTESCVIFINPKHSLEEQREIFFHELCHPFMHIGNQLNMVSEPFRELQEYQANQFLLYAAIPFFMLKQLEIPKYENQLVQKIKTIFKVPVELVKKRLEQIKRRSFQLQMDQGLVAFDKSDNNAETFPLLNDLFSEEEIAFYNFKQPVKSQNQVFYDMYNGEVIPRWYVIHLDHDNINWSKEYKFFSIDAEFELAKINEFQNQETDAGIFKSEIILHPSKPNDFAIDLKQLKHKLKYLDVDPYNITRLIIDAHDLEDVLQLPIVTAKLEAFNTVSTS